MYNNFEMILFDESYSEAVISMIDKAEHEIRVMQYRIGAEAIGGNGKAAGIINALVRKQASGVKVKILLDFVRAIRGQANDNLGVARWLITKGIEVRYLNIRRCAHAKIIVVGDREAIIGSHNWTTNSLTRNLECSIKIFDKVQVGRIVEIYKKLFANSSQFV